MMKKTLTAIALIGAMVTAQAASIENFANVAALGAAGWILNNASTAGGTTDWFQGNASVFTSQAGANDAYIAANYNNAPPGGTISNWLITPTFSTDNFGSVSFWARADAAPGYRDTLEYGLIGVAGAPASFIVSAAFTVPTDAWTLYTLNFLGTGAGTASRFAIHYSGLADDANYVGVDSLGIHLPGPTTPLMLGIGLLGLLAARRRTQH
ncbi:MAG: choice-of-anchor J domain-containing protein [Massilia sp.]|nr:choice-of-anchor J domain-containing protein [Massilia sp.]